MKTLDVVLLVLLGLLMIPLAFALRRYTNWRLATAERLRELGWIQVGFNFWTGPIMVPGPFRSRGRWRSLGLENPEQTMARVGEPSPRKVYRQKRRLRWEWPR
jgi:hypothetical protein